MKNNKRNVNKNLINALIAYRGLDLVSLGRLCDPPVSNAALSMFFAGKAGGERLGTQVTEILRPVLADLMSETFSYQTISTRDFFDVLFPPVSHSESIAPVITEGNNSTLPEKKGEL